MMKKNIAKCSESVYNRYTNNLSGCNSGLNLCGIKNYSVLITKKVYRTSQESANNYLITTAQYYIESLGNAVDKFKV